MIVHVYECPPGEQSTQSASLGANELPRCSSGAGEWIAIDVSGEPPWSPDLPEIAALVSVALFAWGIAWGFRTVVRFAYGRK